MNVTFYSFSKKVNSTARPSGGTSHQVILKEGCSAMQPSIRLTWTGGGAPTSYNYAYISAFGRYYWVRNWTYTERVWEADLAVDVLATYKTQIGASSQYVIRSASEYDGDIVDVLYPATATPYVLTKSATLWPLPETLNDMTFVISTMGRRGMQEYYCVDGFAYGLICNAIFASNFYDGYDFGDISKELVKVWAKPEQNIVNVQWLPLSFSSLGSIGSAVTGFEFGYYEVLPTSTFRKVTPRTVYSFSVPLSMTQHPDAATRGSYCNGNTYTRRELTLPGVGTVAIDNDLLIGYDGLLVDVRVNVASGASTIVLYGTKTGSPNRRIWTTEAKISVDFGYGTNRVDIPGVISAVLGTASSVAEENAVGVANGVLSSIGSAFPSTTILSTSGSVGSYIIPMMMTETFFRQTEMDNADKGRPLCKVKTINTLSGYTVCSDPHVLAQATDDELRQIEGFLSGGFFYE